MKSTESNHEHLDQTASKLPLVPSDVLASIAEALVQRLPSLNAETKDDIARALHDLLDGRDEPSRDRRSGMQRYLIEVAELQDRIPPHNAAEKMLSTEAAAELMQCSQAYVAMLIDNKKLGGASVTKEGASAGAGIVSARLDQ